MKKVLIANEVLQGTPGFDPVGVTADRIADEMQALLDEGRLQLPTLDPWAVFLLGAVGGAVGVRVAKTAFGMLLVVGAGVWALNKLSAPAKVERTLPSQPPLRTPGPLPRS